MISGRAARRLMLSVLSQAHSRVACRSPAQGVCLPRSLLSRLHQRSPTIPVPTRGEEDWREAGMSLEAVDGGPADRLAVEAHRPRGCRCHPQRAVEPDGHPSPVTRVQAVPQ